MHSQLAGGRSHPRAHRSALALIDADVTFKPPHKTNLNRSNNAAQSRSHNVDESETADSSNKQEDTSASQKLLSWPSNFNVNIPITKRVVNRRWQPWQVQSKVELDGEVNSLADRASAANSDHSRNSSSGINSLSGGNTTRNSDSNYSNDNGDSNSSASSTISSASTVMSVEKRTTMSIMEASGLATQQLRPSVNNLASAFKAKQNESNGSEARKMDVETQNAAADASTARLINRTDALANEAHTVKSLVNIKAASASLAGATSTSACRQAAHESTAVGAVNTRENENENPHGLPRPLINAEQNSGTSDAAHINNAVFRQSENSVAASDAGFNMLLPVRENPQRRQFSDGVNGEFLAVRNDLNGLYNGAQSSSHSDVAYGVHVGRSNAKNSHSHSVISTQSNCKSPRHSQLANAANGINSSARQLLCKSSANVNNPSGFNSSKSPCAKAQVPIVTSDGKTRTRLPIGTQNATSVMNVSLAGRNGLRQLAISNSSSALAFEDDQSAVFGSRSAVVHGELRRARHTLVKRNVCIQCNLTRSQALLRPDHPRNQRKSPTLSQILQNYQLLTFNLQSTTVSVQAVLDFGIRLFECSFVDDSAAVDAPWSINGKRPVLATESSAFTKVSKPQLDSNGRSLLAVDSILEQSVAQQDGRVNVGDYVIEVNGTLLLSQEPPEVAEKLINSSAQLVLVVARSLQRSDEQLQNDQFAHKFALSRALQTELQMLRAKYDRLRKEMRRNELLIDEMRGAVARKAKVKQVLTTSQPADSTSKSRSQNAFKTIHIEEQLVHVI